MEKQEENMQDIQEEQTVADNTAGCAEGEGALDREECEAADGAPDSEECGAADGAPDREECGAADGAPDSGECEADNGSEAAGEEKEMTRAEKKAAKKQAKQDKKTDACREQIEQLEDRVKRQMAEFENFRKRTEREKQAMFETGAKSVIEKILPVIDNFERGLATVPEDQKEDPFVNGMDQIYKQLLTELDNIGVKPIEAVGCEFDPNLHNAVMQVENGEYESGVVAQELQKGYVYHDTVVRHSMVAVVS